VFVIDGNNALVGVGNRNDKSAKMVTMLVMSVLLE